MLSLIDTTSELGYAILCAGLVAAALTFALSLLSAAGRPQLLPATRYAMLATLATVATAVFLLAYAFQAHDFSIRYVARYSDRSMPSIYLWTALWGGQDGSLLWWTFLSSGYVLAFTLWIRDRYRELQPWAFATISGVIGYLFILMLFAANPFAPSYGLPPPDGEGLNPLLQNYWMIIHPPSLYLGLTGWLVPFAICVAALLSGRLDNEWLLASRRWVLLAWGFLSLGNMLGMYWSYLELGWGGYWAWDPVENASFFAWLTGTAVLHSAMIQERRGILKVWNVGLMLTTYVLTVFGTFLTRAGLIASVHSFARSDIGAYLGWFLVALIVFCLLLVAWRLPDLRRGERISPFAFVVAGSFGALAAVLLIVSGVDFPIEDYVVVVGFFPALLGVMKLIEIVRLDGLSLKAQEGKKPRGIESLLSREFAFLLNNWIFVAMLVIVLVFTTFPLVSEVLEGVTVTIGPAVYNHWMVPFGLILLFLSGIGPLISWRKATGKNLLEAFRIPVLAMLAVAVLHVLVGPWLGVPPFVETTEIYDNFTGQALAAMMGISPFVSFALCGFVTATILQEFWRGTKVRMRTKKEPAAVAMFQLVSRARRRYGGYIVHLGIVGMFIGFTGAAYDVETEASVRPGQSLSVADYEFRYDAVRTSEDPNKQMVFADVSIFRAGQPLGVAHPARFVYRTHPDMPTTEVDIVESLRNDLYVIMSGVDTRTEEAQFRVVVRPLVMWIWLGGAVLLLGCFIAFVPTLREILGEARQPKRVPARGALAAATTLLIVLVLLLFGVSAASAQSDSSSSLHAGTVVMQTSEERQLFERLLCECGDCQRLPLSTCGCSWAEGMRAEVRAKMERGDSIPTITDDYRDRFGAQALAIPADEGLSRSMWLLPLAAAVLAGLGLVTWARRSRPADEADSDDGESGYDQRLEDELSAFEGD